MARVLQLESDAGLFTDAAGTTPATNESDPIQLWQDQSGQANHASIEASEPTLTLDATNEQPALVFNGSSNLLNIADSASLKIGGDMTCLAIVALDNWADGLHNTLLAKGPHDAGLNYLFGKGSGDLSNALKFTYNDGSFADVTDPSLSAGVNGQFALITWVVDRANGEIAFRINGVTVGTATELTLSYPNDSTVGGRVGANNADGEFFDGQIAAVVLWDEALGGSALTDEESRLMTKFLEDDESSSSSASSNSSSSSESSSSDSSSSGAASAPIIAPWVCSQFGF